MNPKVKILGAGISGLSAAINLSQAGYEVEVYEKKIDAGARFFGDLQGLENYSEHGNVMDWLSTVNIRADFYYKALPPLKALDGKGLSADFEFARALCYLVKRGTMQDSLDQALKRQAMENGVRIFFNQKVDSAKMDIIAVGTATKEIFAVAKGIRFETGMPDMAVAIVNDDAAVKGYSYLLVVDGYGCICTTLFDQFYLAENCYQKTLLFLAKVVELDIQNPVKVGGIGSFSLAGNFKINNQLFVGEAAGLQDLLWGFGIRSAMQSGYLAAKSIIEGLDYSSLALSHFQPKLKASMAIRYLFEKIGRFGYGSMLKYTNKREDPIGFLYKAHQFKSVHKLIFPLARYSMRKRYRHLIL